MPLSISASSRRSAVIFSLRSVPWTDEVVIAVSLECYRCLVVIRLLARIAGERRDVAGEAVERGSEASAGFRAPEPIRHIGLPDVDLSTGVAEVHEGRGRGHARVRIRPHEPFRRHDLDKDR